MSAYSVSTCLLMYLLWIHVFGFFSKSRDGFCTFVTSVSDDNVVVYADT